MKSVIQRLAILSLMLVVFVAAAAGMAQPAATCTVTPVTVAAPIHVAPNLQSQVRGSLAVGEVISVRARATDASGTLWWNVAPPGVVSGLGRYWVADIYVTTSGNCAAITTATPAAASTRGSLIRVPLSVPTATPPGFIDCGLLQPGTFTRNNDTREITFTWNSVPFASTYRVIVANRETNTIVWDSGIVGQPSASADSSNWPGAITWVVQALSGERVICESATAGSAL